MRLFSCCQSPRYYSHSLYNITMTQISSSLPDMVAASSRHVVSSSAGETVTFSCSDETKKPSNLSDITVIIWRKENGSQSLHFATDNKNSTTSNFTDPRFSFLSAQLPPVLQIRDVRPEDAGNYTCGISIIRLGNVENSWTLQISGTSNTCYHCVTP